ncbi:MAG TPA: VOC family protein [Acidimicrobiales bacterium]|nr:VOC family protein [Acidimicrobiales bacterium]
MATSTHHVGICVTDLDRSLRFWCDGLGFETTMVAPVGSQWADALEIGGEVKFTAHFIKKDGFEFELLAYESPRVHGQPSASRNQVGFTHLALYVDDLDATIARLVDCGGTVIQSTRTKIGQGPESIELVFVADPDGVRVELMKAGD